MSSSQNDNVLHAISGAGGGILSTLLTYPLITLSTRSQVESRRAKSTFLDATRRIVQREGVTGLYSGLESAIFGISVTNFVYYYWYEWTRGGLIKRRGGKVGQLGVWENMLAGAIAGGATVLLTNPIWVVNTRMTARAQVASGKEDPDTLPTIQDPSGKKALEKRKLSTLGAIIKIFNEEGWKAFFSGVMPALILVMNPILQYTVYEQLRQKLIAKRKGGPIGAKEVFLLGAIAKMFATASTYPYITVKSRMHVSGGDKKGVVGALSSIVKNEGWAGLYNGIGPKLAQSVITAAFLFAFKDALFAMAVKARASSQLIAARKK